MPAKFTVEISLGIELNYHNAEDIEEILRGYAENFFCKKKEIAISPCRRLTADRTGEDGAFVTAADSAVVESLEVFVMHLEEPTGGSHICGQNH